MFYNQTPKPNLEFGKKNFLPCIKCADYAGPLEHMSKAILIIIFLPAMNTVLCCLCYKLIFYLFISGHTFMEYRRKVPYPSLHWHHPCQIHHSQLFWRLPRKPLYCHGKEGSQSLHLPWKPHSFSEFGYGVFTMNMINVDFGILTSHGNKRAFRPAAKK